MKKILFFALAFVAVVGLMPVQQAVAKTPRVVAKCKICHNFTTRPKVGPGLKGVFGRKAGTMANFKKYSPALKKGGWVWDEAHLRKWIFNAKAAVKEFSGDPKAKTRMKVKVKKENVDKIIAFLKTL